jgi:cytochrome P450
VSTLVQIAPPLFSPAFLSDPYPTYRHCLAGPILQQMPIRSDAWGVFRYDACTRILREPGVSSTRPPHAVVAVPEAERAEFTSFIEHVGRWLLLRDAPAHTRLRKLMNKGFAPLTVEGLRPRVIAAVEELLGKVQSVERFDVIRDFAYPLPVRIISDLLGLPQSLYDKSIALSTDIATWFGNLRRSAEDARLAQTAVQELVRDFEAIVQERPAGRKPELLQLLLNIAEAEPGITREDVYAQCVLLLLAGHETTRNLIGNGILTLLHHPQALEELRKDPAAISAAVEEILRFESPVQAFGRTTLASLEMEGTVVPAGCSVIVFIGAAHRDPVHYENPDRFDIHRRHNRHMAFGADAHVCLGSTLARLEAQVALSALIERFPRLRLTEPTPDWGPNFAFRGLRSLQVAVN